MGYKLGALKGVPSTLMQSTEQTAEKELRIRE